ncbi:MAG: LPS export ABC transporter permease LptG [Desulfuromonadales bacterium]|nr:LPS export ABC transporter permease LptG [Desulfuromonadales bacterium]
MRILFRYIGTRLAWGWLLVFLIMTALFSILELVGQLDDIGEGRYQILDAFMYVAYTTPGRVLSLAAVSSLLGSIVALGTLANGDELLAMRACGFSVFRIAGVILSAGVVLMLGVLLLAQFVVPPLERQARINRELALADLGTLLPEGGFWTRDNNRFINVRSSTPGEGLGDLSVYDFDEQGKPSNYITARNAEIGKDGSWVCRDVRQITFSGHRIVDQALPTLTLDVFLKDKHVEVLNVTPSMLSITALYQYVQVLQKRGQNTDQYVLSLWQKLTLPLKVAAMIFFSLPFVFGKAREASSGRRITLGSIIGISYFYFDQALGYMGLLIGLHPAFTILLPLIIIVLMTLWLLLRVP